MQRYYISLIFLYIIPSKNSKNHSINNGYDAEGTVSRTYLHEGILFPAPGTATLVAKDEVPVVVFVTAATDVLVQQIEGVLAGTPVHRTVSALALTLDEV